MKGFRRATHTVGTGGVGEIIIVKDPKFPEHEFFRAGMLRSRVRTNKKSEWSRAFINFMDIFMYKNIKLRLTLVLMTYLLLEFQY